MPPEIEFPRDDDEAAERAAVFKMDDPFPSIPPALLSAAEIRDYARDTGMLHPFFPDDLKSASYEAYLGGRFIMWDETGKPIDKQLKRGDPCRLPANSIAFVQVEPRFRLPYYIAPRFNLRITHVHRGLLLGTGPLVDPGFDGDLLIPLHNLTASDYEIDTTKALIWIEFTKTSFGFKPKEEAASYPRHHVDFGPEKTKLTPETYLQKASGGVPIRSSIPDVIRQSKESANVAATSAQDAKNAAEKARRTLRNFGIGATLAIAIALTAIVLQVYSLVQDSHSLSTSVAQEMNSLTAKAEALGARIKELQSDLISTQNQVIATESDNDALDLRLFNLEKDISDLRRAANETARPQQ